MRQQPAGEGFHVDSFGILRPDKRLLQLRQLTGEERYLLLGNIVCIGILERPAEGVEGGWDVEVLAPEVGVRLDNVARLADIDAAAGVALDWFAEQVEATVVAVHHEVDVAVA